MIRSTVVLAILIGASFDTSDWTWHARVTVPGDVQGFVRLPLSPEILDQASPTRNDLRLLDESGSVVPYVLRQEHMEDLDQVHWRDVTLINQTFLPESHARATLDFGGPTVKNEVKVRLSESNFRRRVLVEGSADGQTWDVLVENAWLFDINLPGHLFRIDTIDLPKNDFRYLRLTVYNMADDPRRISVHFAQAAFHEKVFGQGPTPVRVLTLTGPTPDKDHRYVAYDVDVGYRHLPLSYVVPRIDDALFYRGYELFGRNAEVEEIKRTTESGEETMTREAPWQPVQQGVLYRVQQDGKSSESTEIRLGSGPYRYLQLRVFNEDNPPLTIRDVAVSRREISLVFGALPKHAYSLVGGNLKAQAPQFDLARVLPETKESAYPLAQVEPPVSFERKPVLAPWTERHAALVWVALLVAAGLMAGLLIVNLRRARPKSVEG